jgi:hypothetical protein
MDFLDIFFVFFIVVFLLGWAGVEAWFSKSNDAKWITKARGKKSLKKYRQSILGRKLSGREKVGILSDIEKKQFTEVETEQIYEAMKREENRLIGRWACWIFIILFLGVRIFSGE